MRLRLAAIARSPLRLAALLAALAAWPAAAHNGVVHDTAATEAGSVVEMTGRVDAVTVRHGATGTTQRFAVLALPDGRRLRLDNAAKAAAGTQLTVSGQGLAPMPVGSLTDDPQLLLPKITLVHEQHLDGETAEPTEMIVPDDVAVDGSARVQWISSEQMTFEIFPELDLEPGVWGLRIDNPNDKQTYLDAALVAVPAPTVTAVEPQLKLCSSMAPWCRSS